MGEDRDRPPAADLYSLYLMTGEHRDVVGELWGNTSANLLEARKLALDIRSRYETPPDNIEVLKKEMKRQLKSWGILTSKVGENIDRLEQGAVESGHQPVCLGGPSLILNKIACAKKLSELSEDGPLVPLFYVADYDGIQSELLNIRVPSPSPRGLLLSLPAGEELMGSPIYQLRNPPEEWFKQNIEKILNNYRGLLKGSDRLVQEGKLQNLEHALTILRNTYYSSENVAEWSIKALGSLVNLESDLGVTILIFSTPSIRPLFQSGYELLLSEPSRSTFIKASNRAVEIIEGAGHQARIGSRADDYVPFFLECMSDGCHRKRIELRYRSRPGSSTAHIVGKCPSCGQEYDFSFDADHPDLSEVVNWISPRVDSRQVIVDSVIPVLCHVGGPGETGYYAEVAPAARGVGVPFPTFFRYTRVFYNTPWNQRQSDILKAEGCPTLLSEALFSALSKWVEGRNAGEVSKVAEAHSAIRRSVEASLSGLLEKEGELVAEIDAIKKELRNSENRSTLLEELKRKQCLSNVLNAYLSSAYGRYSPEQFGQEVSWSWLDLATVTGVGDLMGVFLRQYSENTPNSSMFFVNL